MTLDGPRSPFLRDLDFTVHALGPVLTRFGYCSRLVPWLRRNRDRFDGVVVHGLWQYIGWAVRRALRPHKPYLVFTHGMLDPYFKRAYPFKHLKKVVYWLAVRVLGAQRRKPRAFYLRRRSCAGDTKLLAVELESVCRTVRGKRTKDRPYRGPRSISRCISGAPAHRWECQALHFVPRANPCQEGLRPSARSLQPHLRKGARPTAGLFRTGWSYHWQSGTKEFGRPKTQVVTVSQRSSRERPQLTKLVSAFTGRECSRGIESGGLSSAARRSHFPHIRRTSASRSPRRWPVGSLSLISDRVNIWRQIVVDGAAFVGSDTLEGTLQTLENWIALTSAQKIAMGALAFDCFRRNFDMKANAMGSSTSFQR